MRGRCWEHSSSAEPRGAPGGLGESGSSTVYRSRCCDRGASFSRSSSAMLHRDRFNCMLFTG